MLHIKSPIFGSRRWLDKENVSELRLFQWNRGLRQGLFCSHRWSRTTTVTTTIGSCALPLCYMASIFRVVLYLELFSRCHVVCLRAVPHRCSQFAVSNARSLLVRLIPCALTGQVNGSAYQSIYRLRLCFPPTCKGCLNDACILRFTRKRALQPICSLCSVRGSLRFFDSVAL